jgi:GNAT superfamily N-acetyltransferase
LAFTIRPFQARDQMDARQLILTGLGEHFGWIDETRNPDLNDIAAYYLARGHTFLVAESNGQIVGTGVLLTESADAGRIARMSVSRAHRRKGIGRALVLRLLEEAKRKKLVQVHIETNHGWENAIGLYRHCGFEEYKHDEDGVHFSLELTDR